MFGVECVIFLKDCILQRLVSSAWERYLLLFVVSLLHVDRCRTALWARWEIGWTCDTLCFHHLMRAFCD